MKNLLGEGACLPPKLQIDADGRAVPIGVGRSGAATHDTQVRGRCQKSQTSNPQCQSQEKPAKRLDLEPVACASYWAELGPADAEGHSGGHHNPGPKVAFQYQQAQSLRCY